MSLYWLLEHLSFNGWLWGLFFFVFAAVDLTPQGSSGINHMNEAVLCTNAVSLEDKFCENGKKLNTSKTHLAKEAERRAVLLSGQRLSGVIVTFPASPDPPTPQRLTALPQTRPGPSAATCRRVPLGKTTLFPVVTPLKPLQAAMSPPRCAPSPRCAPPSPTAARARLMQPQHHHVATHSCSPPPANRSRLRQSWRRGRLICLPRIG